MHPSTRLIIWLSLLLGFTSMVYFLSLPAHLPVIVTCVIVLVYAFISYRWFTKHIPYHVGLQSTTGDSARAYMILVAGLAVIVYKAYNIEKQYGHWDAWWLWDHHARYLQDSTYWRQLFTLNDEYHPDYPLFLSSLIAFFWRLTGTFNSLVPYTFSIFIAVVIPATIFISLHTRNLTIACFAFVVFAFSDAYHTFALAQYADQPLGFLYLCAFICLENARQQKHLITVIGGLLGCCIWMKNEGMLLSLIFILFNARTLLANGNATRFAAGIVFPLSVYAYLKLNAPANDLVKGQSMKTIQLLADGSRYRLIGSYFYTRLTDHALPATICAVFYGVYCYAARRLPGRNILTLITCAIGFALVYLLTPHDLSWHLNTSFDRVLFQLMPAFVYVIARNLCNLRFYTEAGQFQ